MDLTRQAETMIDLLSSDHTEEDDIYHKFHLSRSSSLYVAWLWDGILLWGNEIRLDKLSYPMTLFNENDYLLRAFTGHLCVYVAGDPQCERKPAKEQLLLPGRVLRRDRTVS